MTKYKAIRVEIDGWKFASKAEGRRYEELKLLLRAKEIRKLRLQPKFPLMVQGKLICTYIADFAYLDRTGAIVIEDVKGVLTPVFKLKAKLFAVLYPKLKLVLVK